MPLSWNEIRTRAHNFVSEWTNRPLPSQGEERAEAQTFWNEFFEIFGKKRRHLAAFEAPVRNLGGHFSRIDLLWPGTLLAEHKSPGQDLAKAHTQALNYIADLQREGRDAECPRWLIVSDFKKIALHDLEPEQDPDLPLFKRLPPTIEFPLAHLPKMVHAFGFIAGYRTYRVKEEDPANIEAATLLAELHDVLDVGGYPRKDIDRFLVRVLFCLFAEDTGIFHPNWFADYITNHTHEDGSDLGLRLEALFRVLDTPENERQPGLDDDLAELPYVNGLLFQERLEFANFNPDMRNQLLACSTFQWSRISPAVFGSLFQSIMGSRERRQIGAHYTTERDILKVIRSLFLDDLRAEFDQIKADRSTRRTSRLQEFQEKLASIHLLDPACGCGNFLILAYRELRELEIEILSELVGNTREIQRELTAGEFNFISKVDVDQLYGIEIGEWPARIAEVAVWLMDHLCNQKLSAALGKHYQRLPLKKSATIRAANALRIDWNEVLPAEQCTYVFGNPPFVGGKYMDTSQRADMKFVCGEVRNHGLLDYVTAWYFATGKYIIDNPDIRCAFVSTSSITQGEQVGTLWTPLFSRGLKIHFGHRTFPWMSEAKGRAHVHVVIIGFGLKDVLEKHITDYESDPALPVTYKASNIAPYLIEGADFAIQNRGKPLCEVPKIGIGNKPIDGGFYLFTSEEKREFLSSEPKANQFFHRWIGSEEFINGIERWCLWLGDCSPSELRSMPLCLERVECVAKYRRGEIPAKGKEDNIKNKTRNELTKLLATTPRRFHVENFPQEPYLVIPEVSSERRPYIPLGFQSPSTFCSNLVKLMEGATPYHFGVLSSAMHMAWVRQVCGRLESRYRYSSKLVYNNYPWPVDATEAQREKIEELAQEVLEARKPFLEAGQTLADLYDPLIMPAGLLKAHQALDRAVDRAYRKEAFESDRQRVEFLFALYQRLVAPLLPAQSRRRSRRAPRTA